MTLEIISYEADLIINEEYNKIAKEVLDTFGEMPIPNKFKSLTEANLSTINALKFQSYSGFEDIGERFIKVINDELYQSTIAGRPFEDMVSNIRSHINGVYKKSNQTEINDEGRRDRHGLCALWCVLPHREDFYGAGFGAVPASDRLCCNAHDSPTRASVRDADDHA